MAEGIPQIVAKCGSAGTHDDDPAPVQPMFRVGQEAGKQERSLARHWNTGVLAQQRQGYRPIAVVGDESTQEIEDGMPHEVSVAPVWVGHSCPTLLNLNFAGGSMSCSPVAGRWGQVSSSRCGKMQT